MFSTPFHVRRILHTANATVDCASAIDLCRIGAAKVSDYAEHAGATINFDPTVPLPPPPSIVVVPSSTGLVDGQAIGIFGSGFPAGAGVRILECLGGGGTIGCRDTGFTGADGSGGIAVIVNVRRQLGAFLQDPTDCADAIGTCELVVISLADPDAQGVVPLGFDPAGPLPIPTVDATPATGLAYKQDVTLSGTGFANQYLQVFECKAAATSDRRLRVRAVLRPTVDRRRRRHVHDAVQRAPNPAPGVGHVRLRDTCPARARSSSRATPTSSPPAPRSPSIPTRPFLPRPCSPSLPTAGSRTVKWSPCTAAAMHPTSRSSWSNVRRRATSAPVRASRSTALRSPTPTARSTRRFPSSVRYAPLVSTPATSPIARPCPVPVRCRASRTPTKTRASRCRSRSIRARRSPHPRSMSRRARASPTCRSWRYTARVSSPVIRSSSCNVRAAVRCSTDVPTTDPST